MKMVSEEKPLAEVEPIDWDGLLKRAQGGDGESQNDLCGKIKVRLGPILQYRLWGWPSEELEDILQDTLVVFLQKLDQIESNPHHYALEVLRHKIGDALRTHKRVIAVGSSEGQVPIEEVSGEETGGNIAQAGGNFNDDLETKDLADYIRKVIKKLSLFCQTFFLAILEDRTIGEVWQFVQEVEPDLQRSTFDKRVFDCRRRLRQLVKKEIQM